MEIMENILIDVVYGHIFLSALRWLKQFILKLESENINPEKTNRKKLDLLYLEFILKSPYGKEGEHSIVCFFAQTADQLIGLLETAEDKSKLKHLLDERLNPTKYQRPTAEATVQQVDIAIKYIGNFTNTVMSYEEVSKLANSATIMDISNDSMTGFKKQRELALYKTHNKSFAEKCNMSTLDVELSNITTISNLVQFMNNNPLYVYKLVFNGTMSDSTLIKTTLSKNICDMDYLWSFTTNSDSIICNMNVKTIIYRNNGKHKFVMLLPTTPIEQTCKRGNCCFPEFLNSEYKRNCGTAFENLNKTTTLDIPVGITPAFAKGTCPYNENNEFRLYLNFCINDKINLKISKL